MCNAGHFCASCPEAQKAWDANVDYPSAEERLRKLIKLYPNEFARFSKLYWGDRYADLFEEYLIDREN